MYLMYVDESGDVGMENSPTRYFALTGLVVHELRWREYLNQLIDFRRRMHEHFGLRLREELHSSQLITRPGALTRIKRHDRLTIIRFFANELASMGDLNLINIVIDKQGKTTDCDVFEIAWRALIQRFENTLSHRNFSGPANPDDRGVLLPDHTDDKRLVQLLRRMRHFNPVPNQPQHGMGYRNLTLTKIIEDPNFRDSRHSYFIQAADLAAYLLYQFVAPNAYIRKRGAKNYLTRLEPILCKVASTNDPYGIVRL
ncbi:MAG: DUF3800 domain-containing protein [Planctomycetes bacterium]|nr:DUF3800 domain-containing protein [Planctomycetota bacterium]